jgi:hypothetical protein
MKKADLDKGSELSGGESDWLALRPVSWQQHLVADVAKYGADAVVEAVVLTHDFVKERRVTAEQRAILRWHGYAWWALPQQLFVAPDMLVMREGVYHRAWLCELDGVVIDGHVWDNTRSGCCQVCGL